jgi:hypothetical protein
MTPDPQLEIEVRAQLNRLRGRLAGFIEGCGLPEKQERSMISTMKSLTYDAESDLIDLIHD